MNHRFAEEANYWDTTVHPAKSQGEISELLENFGAQSVMVATGQSNGRTAWLVRFTWRDASYRFLFVPLICRYPTKLSSFGGKRREHTDQARYQMGRVAVHFVKAILTAAEMNPDALFGFLELPGAAGTYGMPHTAAELDVSQLTSAAIFPDLPLLEG